MTTNVFITSFHELVHHMTADRALAMIGLASLIWTFCWAVDGARSHFDAAKVCRAQKIYSRISAHESRGWQLFWRGMCAFPRAFLIGASAACLADYLVLVIMNSMGW